MSYVEVRLLYLILFTKIKKKTRKTLKYRNIYISTNKTNIMAFRGQNAVKFKI